MSDQAGIVRGEVSVADRRRVMRGTGRTASESGRRHSISKSNWNRSSGFSKPG